MLYILSYHNILYQIIIILYYIVIFYITAAAPSRAGGRPGPRTGAGSKHSSLLFSLYHISLLITPYYIIIYPTGRCLRPPGPCRR